MRNSVWGGRLQFGLFDTKEIPTYQIQILLNESTVGFQAYCHRQIFAEALRIARS